MKCRFWACLSVITICGFLLTASSAAKVVYVAGDATGDGSGASWENACRTITAGIVASAIGDQIWVKAGRYAGALTFKPQIALYGGFSGTESQIGQRNWITNKTVIDAAGAATRAVDMRDGTRLDGFTVTGGTVAGGIHCSHASAVIANCNITGNSTEGYGGGVFCGEGASLTLSFCSITENTADCGGGLNCALGAAVTLEWCTIAGNVADRYGGGVFGYPESLVEMWRCTVAENTAGYDGGGAFSYVDVWIWQENSGPGSWWCYDSRLGLDECSLTDNTAGRNGGAISVRKHVYYLPYVCEAEDPGTCSFGVTNCLLSDNVAGSKGAAIYHESELVPVDCFDQLVPTETGGIRSDSRHVIRPSEPGAFGKDVGIAKSSVAYLFEDPGLLFQGCVIANNTTPGSGGGLYHVWYHGSVPVVPRLEFVNCTLSGNSAATGSGIHRVDAGCSLLNSIVWNQGVELGGQGELDARYSCIRGGYSGLGNTALDPEFLHPWDGIWGDFHLAEDSPCIDAGDPDWMAWSDACRPPGLGSSRADMGAYGGPLNCYAPSGLPQPSPSPTPTVPPTPTATPSPSSTPTPWLPAGDTNGDGQVDARDLFFFSQWWQQGPNETNYLCNCSSDDRIDEKDLLKLLDAW